MKRLLKNFAFSIALAALAGCGESDNMKRLAEADAVMEDDSEKAMSILETVSTAGLDEEEAAYYALLYTQAQIKNWTVVDSDTLISRAYDYYKDRDEGDRTIRAFFYEAKVAYNAHDLRRAMRDGLAAYEMSKDQDNPFWIAKSAQLLADIFSDVYNYPMAEKYDIETIENYRRAGHVSNERYAIADLSLIHLNEGKYDKAFKTMDSLYRQCVQESKVDPYFMDYMMPVYVKAAVRANRLNEISQSDYNHIVNADTDYFYDILNQTEYLRNAGEFDLANEQILKASLLVKDDEEKAKILYAQYENAKSSGEYDKAVNYTDSLIYLQSKVAQDMLFQTITETQNDFYKQKSIDVENHANQMKIIYTFCILAAIIALWILYLYKMRLKKREIEAAFNSILHLREQSENYYLQNLLLNEKLESETELNQALKNNLNAKDSIENQNNEIILRLFHNQWRTLNKLCDEYLDKQDSGNDRNLLFKNITDELNRLKSPENITQMEKSVNEFVDGIMIKLRNQLPSLKENDYTFLMLNYAGLSPRAICIFTDIKYKTFQNKRLRLRKKIEISNALDKELFLHLLG